MGHRFLSRRQRLLALCCATACAALSSGCMQETQPADYVARVEDRYLFEEDVERIMEDLAATGDPEEMRDHIANQWITTELLHREALRRGLAQDPEVRRRLGESERSVLVNALVESFYRENTPSPGEEEMRAWFEQHKEQLRLREPFVRIRYLRAETAAEARRARSALLNARAADRDSVWTAWAAALSTSPGASDMLFAQPISARDHYPESRLFVNQPLLRQALASLGDERTAPIVESDSSYHVLQMAQRIPTGSIPEREWIQSELERQIVLQNRKQLYARLVQRLTNEALAREALESP